MDNLNNITGIVAYLLETEPESRNSDYDLYYHVCKMLNPMALGISFGTVLKYRKDFGLPSIESVGRVRRKVVEKHPEFAGNDTVEGNRILNEEAFREFARG